MFNFTKNDRITRMLDVVVLKHLIEHRLPTHLANHKYLYATLALFCYIFVTNGIVVPTVAITVFFAILIGYQNLSREATSKQLHKVSTAGERASIVRARRNTEIFGASIAHSLFCALIVIGLFTHHGIHGFVAVTSAFWVVFGWLSIVSEARGLSSPLVMTSSPVYTKTTHPENSK